MRSFGLFLLRLLATVLVALLGTETATSQITLQVGGGLGILTPRADFGGSTIEYYQGTRYGLSNGLNVHGKVRVGLLAVTLVGEVGYSSLSNSGPSAPGRGTVEVSQKVITFKGGPELHMKIPFLPVTPYLGANIAVNQFRGETIFQGVEKVPTGTFVVKSASRLGVGLTGGTTVKLSTSTTLDLSVHYNLMNLSGRSWEDVDPSQDQRLDSYLALNDDQDPIYRPSDEKHFIAESRSIHSLLIAVSIMFEL